MGFWRGRTALWEGRKVQLRLSMILLGGVLRGLGGQRSGCEAVGSGLGCSRVSLGSCVVDSLLVIG